ncbi:hypothetical protein SK571_40480 [Lentzea sp. BCCO 10_0798]|uniref:Uncharacterized protein n=1 Tax=Lentzea kristufekii TaxID=3095430 RepID=A0ABU4U5A0_9PSEU|nr:hypothetical protein [Lentzea sp. BCCO 10_0798]MDX8055691.1 hypothetical protein [Lentzea sp. BCCO 10_0798]
MTKLHTSSRRQQLAKLASVTLIAAAAAIGTVALPATANAAGDTYVRVPTSGNNSKGWHEAWNLCRRETTYTTHSVHYVKDDRDLGGAWWNCDPQP